jgi:transposase-like protein
VKYVPFKDRKAVTADLKKIYLAPSEELTAAALEDFARA